MPRLSADVDVTLHLDPDEPERFAREMADAGFALRVADPDFVRRTRVMPFVHGGTGMPLDVVLAGSGLEDEFLDRAYEVEVGSVRLPVIHPEDLVIAKILAGRPKDVEDATTLWRLHGGTLSADRVLVACWHCSRRRSGRATWSRFSSRCVAPTRRDRGGPGGPSSRSRR